MIDPSMTDILTVDERDERISKLDSTLSDYRTLVAGYEYRVERLRDYLVENAEGSIDKRAAEDIAEIMDIELVKDYYFDVTVRFSGSIQVGVGEDAEEILADSQFDMTNYSHQEFHINDSDVEEISITDYN